MNTLKMYHIRPLEKKSIYLTQVLNNADTAFEIEEHYRFGNGYFTSAEALWIDFDPDEVRVNPNTGFGCDYDEGVATWINVIKSKDDAEQVHEMLMAKYEEGFGVNVFYDEYEVDEEDLVILAPYQIDEIDPNTGALIKENVAIEDIQRDEEE